MDSLGSLRGRTREARQVEAALTSVERGRGALLLLTGEAGIGKTTLAGAIADAAAERGARIVWGRAWEAGDAPVFWLWTQVFRSLGLEAPWSASTSSPEPCAEASFEVLDAATETLRAMARTEAVVIVLDDLHAADAPSLRLLHLLARQLRDVKLLLVGTHRDVEARACASSELFSKLAREGTRMALARLTREDVSSWLGVVSPGLADTQRAALAARLHAVTEGNPLFLREVHAAATPGNEQGPASLSDLPDALHHALEANIARLPEGARVIVAAGSVLGRELAAADVAHLAGVSLDDVHVAFDVAIRAGVLAPRLEAGAATFTHGLLRERVYAGLAPSRRTELHARAGEAILARGGDATQAAVHLLDAGVGGRAASMTLEAARQACAQTAFDEAARLCARALAAHCKDDSLTCELELLRAESRIRAGEVAEGQEEALAVADRARRLEATEGASLLARAALVYAIEMTAWSVDARMVRLLEEALARTPDDETPLRAQLLARHAAAVMPTSTEEGAAAARAEGDRAIALARRLGDTPTLRYALRFGGAALGFVRPAAAQDEIAREMLAHADGANRSYAYARLELLPWSSMYARLRGDVQEARAAEAEYVRVAARFEHPHFAWRILALRARAALLDGAPREAQALGDRSLRIAEEAGLAVGVVANLVLALGAVQMQEDYGAAHRIGARLHRVLTREGVANGLGFGAKCLDAWLESVSDDDAPARRAIERLDVRGEIPSLLVLAEGTTVRRDAESAGRLYPAVCAELERNPFLWGPSGLGIFGPTARIAADLARLLGRADEARAHDLTTLALGERMQSPLIVGMAKRRLAAARTSVSASAAARTELRPGVATVELTRQGETWALRTLRGGTLTLKDSKGLGYIAPLLDQPGRAVHVLELCDAQMISPDAARVLDPQAKREIRTRLAALEEDLEEATRLHDLGRVAVTRAERERILEELASALGLGDRDRPLGSVVERLRVNVQRCIADAVARIEALDAASAEFLRVRIRTGAFCSFYPA